MSAVSFSLKKKPRLNANVTTTPFDEPEEPDAHHTHTHNGSDGRGENALKSSSGEDSGDESKMMVEESEKNGLKFALEGDFKNAVQHWLHAAFQIRSLLDNLKEEKTEKNKEHLTLTLTTRLSRLLEQISQGYMELEEYFSAVQFAQKAVDTDSSWSIAYLTLGRAQLNWGDPELAKGTLEKGLDVCKLEDQDDPSPSSENEVLKLIREELLNVVSILKREKEKE